MFGMWEKRPGLDDRVKFGLQRDFGARGAKRR